MKALWNERYGNDDYVYGKEPNQFFAQQLQQRMPGTIVLPCEGEGRNAVFAASLGWNVIAFDQSELGKDKAMLLAKEKKVNIQYTVSDALAMDLPENSVELVTFIYAHFPSNIRQAIHRKAIQWLKPGGSIILEAFNPTQLNKRSGGPKDISMLYTQEMLAVDFEVLKLTLHTTETIELQEGKLHQGLANVIRLIGVKI